jgi:hypothetical protein
MNSSICPPATVSLISGGGPTAMRCVNGCGFRRHGHGVRRHFDAPRRLQHA